MNFIAGYLIIITKDEEKSFWLMDALLAKMLPGTFDGNIQCWKTFGKVIKCPL